MTLHHSLALGLALYSEFISLLHIYSCIYTNYGFNSLGVSDALAFDAKNLSTVNTIELVMKLCKQIIILGEEFSSALRQSLRECVTVGKHTNIVHLGVGSARKYIWAHKDYQPWGNKLPLQCPQCGKLKPWVVTYMQKDKEYRAKCENGRCGEVGGRKTREAILFSFPYPEGISSIKVGGDACWLEVPIVDQ